MVNFHGAKENMNDELSLSFYNVKDGTHIFLENLSVR